MLFITCNISVFYIYLYIVFLYDKYVILQSKQPLRASKYIFLIDLDILTID